jgi:hypothetical protein
MAPLRWVFLVAAAPKPEADARLGAALDAPVFGRGFALPKLGIVFLIPHLCKRARPKQASKIEANAITNVRRCGLVELR